MSTIPGTQLVLPLLDPLPAARRAELAKWIEPDWRDVAACEGMDDDTFYPAPDDLAAERRALTICAGCPVRVSCLATALLDFEALGVWGGTTAARRDELNHVITGAAPVHAAFAEVTLPERAA